MFSFRSSSIMFTCHHAGMSSQREHYVSLFVFSLALWLVMYPWHFHLSCINTFLNRITLLLINLTMKKKCWSCFPYNHCMDLLWCRLSCVVLMEKSKYDITVITPLTNKLEAWHVANHLTFGYCFCHVTLLYRETSLVWHETSENLSCCRYS